MFKRRHPHSPLQHIRELFWPSMGWPRTLLYVRLRITRMSDSTHKIAAGLAVGTSIAFTPILGTHFIQAGLLAWIFRLNIFSAILGTFLANPWTIPFMWWGSIMLGAWIFSFFGIEAETAMTHHMDFPLFWHLLVEKAGSKVVGGLCIVELDGLNGRSKLNFPFESLLLRPA